MDVNFLKSRAMERLTIANHIIDTTYALVNEPKLFLSVVENIYEAFDLMINEILTSKNVRFESQDYDGKIELFCDNVDLKSEVVLFLKNLRHTIDEHKNASVEFVRNDKYIISDNDYNLTALGLDGVKSMINDAKRHIDTITATV